MKKLLIIIVLSLFFFQGCSSKPKETDLLLPVHFLSMPSYLVKTSPFTKNIEIHIKGTARLVKQISADNLSYHVDLYTDLVSDPAGDSGVIEPGLYSIPVIKERIPLLPGVIITNINPSFITIRLQKAVTRLLPITIPYTGKPALGYIALPAKPEPDKISLTGADSIINTIKSVKTKPVDITGSKESFKKEVPVDIDKASGIKILPKIVMVSVPIKEKTIIRTFRHISVETKNNCLETIITPREIQIQVKGYANILKEKTIEKKFKIYMDLNGLKPGIYVRRAIIILPVGLILISARPEIFTVKIKPKG